MLDRDLRVVDTEAEIREFENELAKNRRRLDELNRVTAMFRSAGWKTVEEDLLGLLNYATRQLIGDSLREMPAIAFVRGQMRAYEYLLDMPGRMKQDQEAIREDLKQQEETEDI